MPARRATPILRSVLVLSLTTVVVIQFAAPVWAWGGTGHRVIARLAEHHLTNQPRAEVKALLEPGESLAKCSTWADEFRGRMQHIAPWHYVDVPLDEPRYDDRFAADDGRMGYLVPKIRGLRVTLKDRSKSVEERRFALRFLVHLVEDLHMPMHVGENHDRGGNDLQLRWYDRGSNPHRIWDSGIIEHAGRGEDGWLADLVAMDTDPARADTQKGTVEGWATESLLPSRAAYVDPATGKRLKPGAKLGDVYQQRSLPVVKERLYRAGIRLARVLNEALWAD